MTVDFCEELCYHSLPKKQSEEGEYGGKKQRAKAAVLYTFCSGKVSVKVRTGFKKMWYNMSARKTGKRKEYKKTAANLAVEEREQSRFLSSKGAKSLGFY